MHLRTYVCLRLNLVSDRTVRDDLRLTKVAPGYFVLTGAQSMFHEKHMDLGEPERWMLLN